VNIVGVTQGSNLRLFISLEKMLRSALTVNKVAAYVADSREFRATSIQEKDSRWFRKSLLKEWDILEEALRVEHNIEVIKKWEEILGDPVFWNVLISDRRIFFGRRCKFRQDYKPRFTHKQMLSIIETAILRISEFLDRYQPDVIFGFGMSTFGDYLFYRFSRVRNIPYLQLKSTKIKNYVTLNDDPIGLSHHIQNLIETPSSLGEHSRLQAKQYLDDIASAEARYEGAIQRNTKFKPIRSASRCVTGILRDIKTLMDPVVRHDNHVESAFLGAFYSHFIQPLKSLSNDFRLGKHLAHSLSDLPKQPYVYFPLHFEPEVSIQIFGRPFINQIECIRCLAHNLPAGMMVCVKEHPRAEGFRAYGYYEKLLEIPNVRLVSSRLTTREIVIRARFVAVISGGTGLEALALGKPVLVFGKPTYSNLSTKMIRPVTSLNRLAEEIISLLHEYEYNREALEIFIAAHIQGSIPIDLYSVLLSKPNRHSEGREGISEKDKRQEDMAKLSAYTASRVRSVLHT